MTHRFVAVLLLCCSALGGCEPDPARAVKIVTPAAVPSPTIAPPSETKSATPGSSEPSPAATTQTAPSAAAPTTVTAASEQAPRTVAPTSDEKSVTAPLDAKGTPGTSGAARPVTSSVNAKIAPTRQAVAKDAAPSIVAANKIPSTDKSAAAAPKSATVAASEWRPQGCPPPAEEASGPSTLAVEGPCAFEHHALFTCEAVADDFYISMTRKAGSGSTLMVYINVEGYKGPGDYKNAQMFIGLHDRKDIYRWSTDALAITVGAGQAFAVLPMSRLEAEPLLVDCTGPMNNYQCNGGRGTHEQLLASTELVSGTLQCEPRKKKAKE